MEPFVTVAVFTFPTEHPVARAKLESEGITCRVIDQYTIEVYHFMSNGVSGIKLQVPASDYQRAKAILIAGGFLPVTDEVNDSFFERILKQSRTQTIARKVFIGLLAAAFAILIGIVMYNRLNRPDPVLALVNHEWCVDHFTYRGKTYFPATLEREPVPPAGRLRIAEWCDDKLVIREDGSLLLPGYNSPAISGRWDRQAEHLRFGNLDTLPEIFGGDFAFERDRESLRLVSENTEIVCFKYAHRF